MTSSRGVILLSLMLSLGAPAVAGAAPLREGVPRSAMGQAYRDPQSGIIFYVEGDGRHVAAISPEGRLLWRRDPFVDAKLEPYRSARPRIVTIGAARLRRTPLPGAGPSIAIGFDSSQFGTMDIATGDFTFLGQD